MSGIKSFNCYTKSTTICTLFVVTQIPNVFHCTFPSLPTDNLNLPLTFIAGRWLSVLAVMGVGLSMWLESLAKWHVKIFNCFEAPVVQRTNLLH